EVDRERMCHAADRNFLTVTELADTLVREENISFGMAHRLVAASVRAAVRDDSPERLVTEIERLAPDVVGKKLSKPREVRLRAIDPVHFIGIRTIPGASRSISVTRRSGESSRDRKSTRLNSSH